MSTAAPQVVPEAPPAKREDDRDKGIARIKKEFLVNKSAVEVGSSKTMDRIDDDAAESGTSTAQQDGQGSDRDGNERGAKRRKVQGQNKNRNFPQARDRGPKMCRGWEKSGECDRPGNCRFAHSWKSYFTTRPKDIHHDPDAGTKFTTTPPYLVVPDPVLGGDENDPVGSRIDTSTVCPVKRDLGWCPYGMKCRFLGDHIKRVSTADDDAAATASSSSSKPTPYLRYAGWELTDHAGPEEKEGWKQGETNWQNPEVIRQLRFQSYEYNYSKDYIRRIEPHKPFYLDRNRKAVVTQPAADMNEEEAFNDSADVAAAVTASHIPGESEAMDVPMRPEEKRRLNWENGVYLAPLTTVGNLPFRRLCVDYGATITCSEMALAQQLITGQNDEWALLRRHESEKHFGVQVAGGYPNVMVPTAEMLGREFSGGGVDFVDVNLGCPIDLVFNQGAGSALMDASGRLGKILLGMNRALGEIPLTVKFRTGVANGKPNAHKLIPKFATEWGASAMTLHGRSRQQRYSKLADWAYIKQCATTLRETVADANMPPVPIFGNGDCFSAQQYYEEKEGAGVDGVMVARGALIKPWIFTEIQERREWDISATERLDGIRKFAEYGLSHWGSDAQGVNTTRKFLLEALSFQHRYVPIGLLERMPAQMNERPPAYHGRNELETLLASPFCEDWVRISELFLGKVAEDYKFVPKHKSNAYGGEEAQG